ncbi:KilA-N domain-containing protein [Delftia sp. ZNC0008]|uniref:KilA-N domain-containing protein n=1 Tax=Delftia sp. ZNC0008 TaxID=1339242 RepID=UPI0009E0AE7A|nr:KilA-N domain-containing protein [Delftia sp. ZNC0008]
MPHEAEKGNAPEGRSSGALDVSNHLEGIDMLDSIALTIGSTSVRQVDGLFSLNDLHQESGGLANHRPGYFLDNEQTKALLQEIENAGIPAVKTKQGRNGGTYACRELVIAYAAWISAAFHLKVIRVFLAQVAPVGEPGQMNLDYDRISPAQAQDLREIVQAIVDAGIQKHAETWARFQRKFRVNSYLELPAARHMEARQYLIAKLPQGYAPNIVEEAAQPAGWSPERVNSALSLVAEVMPQVSRAIFDAVMTGQNWQADRFMLSFDVNTRGLVPQAKKIDSNAYVIPMDRFYDAIETSMSVEPAVLARLAATCANRLGSMAGRLSVASGT